MYNLKECVKKWKFNTFHFFIFLGLVHNNHSQYHYHQEYVKQKTIYCFAYCAGLLKESTRTVSGAFLYIYQLIVPLYPVPPPLSISQLPSGSPKSHVCPGSKLSNHAWYASSSSSSCDLASLELLPVFVS